MAAASSRASGSRPTPSSLPALLSETRRQHPFLSDTFLEPQLLICCQKLVRQIFEKAENLSITTAKREFRIITKIYIDKHLPECQAKLTAALVMQLIFLIAGGSSFTDKVEVRKSLSSDDLTALQQIGTTVSTHIEQCEEIINALIDRIKRDLTDLNNQLRQKRLPRIPAVTALKTKLETILQLLGNMDLCVKSIVKDPSASDPLTLTTFSGSTSTSQEGSDAASMADAISSSALVEAINVEDKASQADLPPYSFEPLKILSRFKPIPVSMPIMSQEALKGDIQLISTALSDILEVPIIEHIKNTEEIQHIFSSCQTIFSSMLEANAKFDLGPIRVISKLVPQVFFNAEFYSNMWEKQPLTYAFWFLSLQMLLGLCKAFDTSLKQRRLYQIDETAKKTAEIILKIFVSSPEMLVKEGITDDKLSLKLFELFLLFRSDGLSLLDWTDIQERSEVLDTAIEKLQQNLLRVIEETMQSIEGPLEALLLEADPSHVPIEQLSQLQQQVDAQIKTSATTLNLLYTLTESIKNSISTGRSPIKATSKPAPVTYIQDDHIFIKMSKQLQNLCGTKTNLFSKYHDMQLTRARSEIVTEPLHPSSSETHSPSPSSSIPLSVTVAPPPSSSTSPKPPRKAPSGKKRDRALSIKQKAAAAKPSAHSQPASSHDPLPKPTGIIKYRQMEAVLKEHGLVKESTRGSHEKWVYPLATGGSNSVIVPRHYEMRQGTAGSIFSRMQEILTSRN